MGITNFAVSWLWIATVTVIVLAAAASAGGGWRANQEKRRRFDEAVEQWRETPADQRCARFSALVRAPAPNAAAWYLLGCAHLHAYETRLAARAFGMAHHADCGLEFAALLTFACLKAADGPDSDLVEKIITTWEEMRRPELPAHRADSEMAACLAAADPPPPRLSPLGRLVWPVVGPALRAEVERRIGQGVPSD